MFQQHLKDLQGLFLESDLGSVLTELSSTQVNFEDAELNGLVPGWTNIFHVRPALFPLSLTRSDNRDMKLN
jgi:hypothetical protein